MSICYRKKTSVLAILCCAAAAIGSIQSAAQSSCTVRSGVDPVTVAANPPSGAPFGPAAFAAATAPTFVVPNYPGWIASLPCDAAAQWISTANPVTGASSGLYSVVFPCPLPCVTSATLSVCFAVDNNLGNTVNPGVFLNGSPVAATTCLSAGSACFAIQQQFLNLNVTALVVNGLNTLQLFCNNLGGPSGIIFSATLTWVPCTGDRCFQAIPLANGLTNGSNVLATVGSESVGSCGLMGSDVWYVYVPTLCGTLTVDTCTGSNYDTVLTGWDGACGCPGLVQLACNDDTGGCGFSGGLGSSISFSVTTNQTYYISVGGFAGAQGTFTLNVNLVAAAPTNDNCSGAILVPETYKVIGCTVNATTGSPIGNCGGMANDVWYRFIAAKTGSCTVTTCNLDTDYDTVVAVWGGSGCAGLVQLGCNDDSCGINQFPNYYNSTVVFPAVANTQYWVSIGGFSGAVGTYSLKISQDDYLDFKFFDEGPGSVGFRVADTSGWYYFFVTTNAGNYPNGWLGGIDISFADFFSQLHSGYPFHGPLTRCGVVGPFFGLPSGLTLYGVVFGAPAPGAGPTVVSAPASFTIP